MLRVLLLVFATAVAALETVSQSKCYQCNLSNDAAAFGLNASEYTFLRRNEVSGQVYQDDLICQYVFTDAAGKFALADCHYDVQNGLPNPRFTPRYDAFDRAVCPPIVKEQKDVCCPRCREAVFEDFIFPFGTGDGTPLSVNPVRIGYRPGGDTIECTYFIQFQEYQKPVICEFSTSNLTLVGSTYVKPVFCNRLPLSTDYIQGTGTCLTGQNPTGQRARCQLIRPKLSTQCDFYSNVAGIGDALCGDILTIKNLANVAAGFIATANDETLTPKQKSQEIAKVVFTNTLGLARDAIKAGAILSVGGPIGAIYGISCGVLQVISIASSVCSTILATTLDCQSKPVRRSPNRIRYLTQSEPPAFALVKRSSNLCTDTLAQLDTFGFSEACGLNLSPPECVTVAELLEQGATEADARTIANHCDQAIEASKPFEFLCRFYNALKTYEPFCDVNYVDDSPVVTPPTTSPTTPPTGPPTVSPTTPPTVPTNPEIPPGVSGIPSAPPTNPTPPEGPPANSGTPSMPSINPSIPQVTPTIPASPSVSPSIPSTPGVPHSTGCKLVKHFGDSPDTPDSPDGQPELPEILDYPGGFYYLCEDGSVPPMSILPPINGAPPVTSFASTPAPTPVQLPSAGCTWTKIYGDSPDTPDTPDSADGQPEIPEIPEIPQDPVDGSYYWQCLKIPKEKGLIWV